MNEEAASEQSHTMGRHKQAHRALMAGEHGQGFKRTHGERGFMGAGMGRSMDGFSPRMVERLVSKLDLSSEQEDQVYAIVDDVEPKMRKAGRDMKRARQQLKDMMTADTVDTEAVNTIADTIGANVTAMIKDGAGAMEKVRAVLTPDQREKAQELMEKFGKRGMKDSEGEGQGRRSWHRS